MSGKRRAATPLTPQQLLLVAVAVKLFRLKAAIAHNAVERVLRGGGAGFACGADDIALRCRHRLVAKQLHQGVHAHLGVGQLSGVGVPQPVHEYAPDLR